jgi:hypothetical protein
VLSVIDFPAQSFSFAAVITSSCFVVAAAVVVVTSPAISLLLLYKMTIAITLSNSHHGVHDVCHNNIAHRSSSNSAMARIRPYRKLEQNAYKVPHQILPNGFAVVPMLTLQDSFYMQHERRNDKNTGYYDYNHNSHVSREQSFPRLHQQKTYDLIRSVTSFDNGASLAAASQNMMNPRNMKIKKTVRFSPSLSVRTRSVSDDDLLNSWYNSENYLSFEADNRQIVKAFLKQDKYTKNTAFDRMDGDGEETYKLLGLEQFLLGPKHMIQRRQLTIQHCLMVLEIYDVQRCLGQYNPDVVRRVSERCSYNVVHRAIQRARTAAVVG